LIGRHAAVVWQFSQGIVSGPCGFFVDCFCGSAPAGYAPECASAGEPPVAERDSSAQSASWSSVSVDVSAVEAKNLASGIPTGL
jgi:hypothetical protein